MNKISIIGDIICDKHMLKNGKKTKNKYDFKEMFSPLKDYFKDSDYVVANLETTISDTNYTSSTFSFSSPKELLEALKYIGINAVSLANNHILDRGINGIENTIKYLNKYNIKYFGISSVTSKGTLDINLPNIKISILGYTDSTNYNINNTMLEDEKYTINTLKNTYIKIKRKNKNLLKKIYYKISSENRLKIEKFLHIKLKPIIDNNKILSSDKKYINNIKDIIKDLKKQNRFIIMYPHIGGQYNIIPGTYTKEIIEEFKKVGCSNIIITHPHVIQNLNHSKSVFSIGGLIMSPKSNFVVWDTLPQYSAVLNYYFENNKLIKLTISFLICIYDKDTYLKVYPFYDFYNRLNSIQKEKYKLEFDEVFKRIFNKSSKVEKEYVIREW